MKKISYEELFEIEKTVSETTNEYVKLSELKILKLEERNIKIEMPINTANINHIGTFYAIPMIMLMEVTGSTLIRSTFGLNDYTIIIKKTEISFIKPSTKNLICEISISKNEAIKLITPINERGQGNFPLSIFVLDVNNEEIAKANFVFYLFRQ
ncbi:MAG: DUF4442 domain-containing protein [Bacteroidales bacterium]|jgi:acyl-coenzyme A thioesterase PaaI-like protein|nr:DUF4442 domain-containing protein [Bacteroidales bacterium]